MSQPFTLSNLTLSIAAVSACMLVTLHVLPVNGSIVQAPFQSQAPAGAGQPSSRGSAYEGNRARCAECGVVKSILEVDDGSVEVHGVAASLRAAKGAADAVSEDGSKRYRMTVRFRDGTTVTADELTPRSWRAGQRVIVVRASDSVQH